MIQTILSIRSEVLEGKAITYDQAEKLLATPSDLIPYLAAAANEIRIRFCGQRVELCGLVNAKSGACSEDCRFCGQSAHAKTETPVYPLLSADEMVKRAKEAEAQGVTEFCIVTSGKGATKREEFETILEAVRRIKKETSIKIDCSLGFLSDDQMKELKAAGVYRNNHNLETAQSFFENVCTTHRYSDRVEHVRRLSKSGILPCSGGIIGLGETGAERLEMAFALRELNVDCVPINILNPRPGTLLEGTPVIDPKEVIKTIAIYRFILPKSIIKIAGGREVNLRDLQGAAFQAGANGLVLGSYLTTPGAGADRDLTMLRDLGFDVRNRN